MKLTLTLLALLAMTSAASAQVVTANTIVTSGTQTLTIDPIGNGKVIIRDSVEVQGNHKTTGVISSDLAIQTNGTGSIESAYRLSGAGGKFTVAGDTGNVRTNGTLSAASGSFEVSSTGLTKANQGLAVNGAPGLTVGSAFKVTASGAATANGLDNSGKKITGVADGTNATDAVNLGQLTDTNEAIALEKSERISGDAANAAGLAAEMIAREAGDTANAAAIAAEATTRANADAALSARIDAEAAARADADAANANAATAQIAASEARSIKASRQSGALAMAVAGMTGASPTDHGRTAVSMGVGTFGGETALAVGVSHAVTDAVRIFGSVTKVSGGDTGAAIGGSYSF
jgi:hypothetical protein